MMVTFGPWGWLVGTLLLLPVLPWVHRRRPSLPYLLAFSLFWFYLLAVTQVVIFPFFIPSGPAAAAYRPSINLVPFEFGSCWREPTLCARGMIENILLTVPFGFGLNFLLPLQPRHALLGAVALGLGLELSQLLVSVAWRSAFRAVDINDSLLNAAGVLLGYGLYRGCSWAYGWIARRHVRAP